MWVIPPSLGHSSQGTQNLDANLRVLLQPYLQAKGCVTSKENKQLDSFSLLFPGFLKW